MAWKWLHTPLSNTFPQPWVHSSFSPWNVSGHPNPSQHTRVTALYLYFCCAHCCPPPPWYMCARTFSPRHELLGDISVDFCKYLVSIPCPGWSFMHSRCTLNLFWISTCMRPLRAFSHSGRGDFCLWSTSSSLLLTHCQPCSHVLLFLQRFLPFTRLKNSEEGPLYILKTRLQLKVIMYVLDTVAAAMNFKYSLISSALSLCCFLLFCGT